MKIREREQAYSIEYGGKLTSLGWCYIPHTLPGALDLSPPRWTWAKYRGINACGRVSRAPPHLGRVAESFTRPDATDGVASKY
jgi:hypothetical protein